MAVKYAILGLLHYTDMHGYRIKEHLDRNFGYMWSVNYGQIYPTLRRMQEDGLVTMHEVRQEDAPNRKRYSITEKGREEFFEWLNSDPERKMILRDPFLLRFTFFNFSDRERALEIIRDQLEMYERDLERRSDNLPRWRGSEPNVRLMAELGIELNKLMVSWLRKAESEFSDGAVPEGKKNKSGKK